MRYQRNDPYRLPREVYKQVYHIIKDYKRMAELAESILESSGSGEGAPVKGTISDTTAVKAAKRETLLRYTSAIDRAFSLVPPEYRKPIWDNIVNGKPYPDYADKVTFWRYRRRVYWYVADGLNLI